MRDACYMEVSVIVIYKQMLSQLISSVNVVTVYLFDQISIFIPSHMPLKLPIFFANDISWCVLLFLL